jgi:autotransporter-associated beta strand protein
MRYVKSSLAHRQWPLLSHYFKHLSCIVATALVLGGQNLFAQTNLLANGGFELGNTSGWTAAGSEISASTTEKRRGQYGGYVSGRTAEWHGAWINGLHTVLTPGKTYRVSLWIKPAAGTDIEVQLTTKQTSGGVDAYGPVLQQRVCTAGIWSELSGGFTYINPGNTTELSIYVYCFDTTRSYSIDDAEVRIDELSVDLAVTGAPVSQKATGFLHGLGDTVPSTSFYEPLKPRIQRFPAFLANPNMLGIPTGFGSPAYMNRLKAVGARQQVLISDEYMWFGLHTSWGWPGDPEHDGYSSYQLLDEKIDSLLDHALANFPASAGWQIEWDIWNEPDYEYFWGRSQAQFFETWRHAHQRVRAKDPNAVIVGPSIAFFVTQGATPVRGGWLKEFLIYARDNNVLPNIVTWHEMVNPKEIPAQVQLIRDFMAANGIADRPIDVNEYQGPGENLMLSPGNTISFLSSFESTDIRHAIRACWNDVDADGMTNGLFPGRLDNIMTMAPFQPRAQWHVYRSYADMSGSMVAVDRGGFLSGLASVNSAAGKAHLLVGNDGTQAFTTNVTIQNLSQLANFSTTGKVRVRVREIPYSGLNALGAPTEVSNAILTPAGNQLVLPLSVTSRAAYEITVQTIGPKTVSAADGSWNAPATWTSGVPVSGGATGVIHTVNFQQGDAWTGGGWENGMLIGYDSWGANWELSGNGSGTLNVSGGNLTTGYLGLGVSLNGGLQTGTLNISGGTVTADDTMLVGWSAAGGSSVNVSGGILNLSGNADTFVVGHGAVAAMNVTGGTVNLNRSLAFNNASTLNIGGTGLVNLNTGGSLRASPTIQSGGTLKFIGGGGNPANNLFVQGGTVDVNGQTLPAGTWANWLPTAAGNRLSNSSPVPAVIANGNTLWLWNTTSMTTMIEAVGDLTIHSWVTGSFDHFGGITKTGVGMLTLTNPGNDYKGHTVVNAGTLSLNHPTLPNAADVRIASGAVLNLMSPGTDTIRSLYLNGSKQAGGTWGAVGSSAQHLSPLITGPGILQVDVGAKFSDWLSENGIIGEPPDGDFDNDGIKNLIEYALGLSPTQSDASPGTLEDNSITFTKGTAAVDNGDVAYAIQISTTLAPQSWGAVTPTFESPSLISYTFPSGQPRLFCRLIVTQAP